MTMKDYKRGYDAGRAYRSRSAKAEFWREAFVAAVGPAMSRSWERDGKDLRDTSQLMAVAACTADAALQEAEKRGFA